MTEKISDFYKGCYAPLQGPPHIFMMTKPLDEETIRRAKAALVKKLAAKKMSVKGTRPTTDL